VSTPYCSNHRRIKQSHSSNLTQAITTSNQLKQPTPEHQCGLVEQQHSMFCYLFILYPKKKKKKKKKTRTH